MPGRIEVFLAKRVEGNGGAIQINEFYESRGSVKFYSQDERDGRKGGRRKVEG